ncbi:MAG: hypothetical protein ACP5LW_03370 [Nitrososphaeria archaeon]
MPTIKDHEIDNTVLDYFLQSGCLTKLEFIALFHDYLMNNSQLKEHFKHDLDKFFKKPSGERSTLKRRGIENLTSCFMTVVALLALQALNGDDLQFLIKLGETLEDALLLENSDEVVYNLKSILKRIIKREDTAE